MQGIIATLINLDQSGVNFFLTLRTGLGDQIFSIVTWLGEWKMLVPLALIIVVWFWAKNKKDVVWPFLTAVLGAELSGQLLKLVVQRPRPLGGLENESTFSFPSGHALIAVVFYGFLTYYFWQSAKNQAQKYLALALGVILISVIGFSRLYLGVHYLSDVLGGYSLGALWLGLGIFLAERKKNRTI